MLNISAIPNDIWEGLEKLLKAYGISLAEFLDEVEATLLKAPEKLRIHAPEVQRYCAAEGLTTAMWSWGEARRLLREADCLEETSFL